jgi:hypothetical protein
VCIVVLGLFLVLEACYEVAGIYAMLFSFQIPNASLKFRRRNYPCEL